MTRECPGHGISVGRGEDKCPNGAGVQKIHRFFNGQRIVAQVRRVYLTCDRLMKDGEHTQASPYGDVDVDVDDDGVSRVRSGVEIVSGPRKNHPRRVANGRHATQLFDGRTDLVTRRPAHLQRGGTMSEYGIGPGGSPARRSPGHGVWQREHGWQDLDPSPSRSTATTRSVFCWLDKITAALELLPGGDEFAARSAVQILDVNDTVIRTGGATSAGIRFEEGLRGVLASRVDGRASAETHSATRLEGSVIDLRVEFRQLVEVTVVMRDIDRIELRTREDEYVRQGNSQARRPAHDPQVESNVPRPQEKSRSWGSRAS